MVYEYNARKSFRKLGYYDRLETMDCFTADCFAVIETEYVKIKNAKMKRKGK